MNGFNARRNAFASACRQTSRVQFRSARNEITVGHRALEVVEVQGVLEQVVDDERGLHRRRLRRIRRLGCGTCGLRGLIACACRQRRLRLRVLVRHTARAELPRRTDACLSYRKLASAQAWRVSAPACTASWPAGRPAPGPGATA
jgi:hypothetical protein